MRNMRMWAGMVIGMSSAVMTPGQGEGPYRNGYGEVSNSPALDTSPNVVVLAALKLQ
jgi:hypothetical protein